MKNIKKNQIVTDVLKPIYQDFPYVSRVTHGIYSCGQDEMKLGGDRLAECKWEETTRNIKVDIHISELLFEFPDNPWKIIKILCLNGYANVFGLSQQEEEDRPKDYIVHENGHIVQIQLSMKEPLEKYIGIATSLRKQLGNIDDLDTKLKREVQKHYPEVEFIGEYGMETPGEFIPEILKVHYRIQRGEAVPNDIKAEKGVEYAFDRIKEMYPKQMLGCTFDNQRQRQERSRPDGCLFRFTVQRYNL